MKQLLKNQVAWITGSSQGIGKALAIGFAQLGAKIILTSRSTEKLEQVKQEINESGGEALVAPANIQNYKDTTHCIEKGLENFGQIDILVNNAGFSRIKPIHKLRVEQFQDILKTNVIGVYNATHAVIPHMLERESGSILNTGSVVIEQPAARWSAYAMSKTALIGFTECLGKELPRKKININTIHPGPTNTPLFRMGLTEDQIKMMKPMDPSELIPYYAFFATKKAKRITGQNITTDLIHKVLKIGDKINTDTFPEWNDLKDTLEEKLSPEDYKTARKARKLFEFLSTWKTD